MIGAGSVGVPEILIILLVSTVWLIPIAAAVWALITLNRLSVTQDAMRHSLDAIARSLQESLVKAQAERQQGEADRPRPDTGTACAWCGKPVSEGEAFMLRVGAVLCPTCAAEAGRIAAEQRLGK